MFRLFFSLSLNPNVSLGTLRLIYYDYLRPVLVNLVYIHTWLLSI